VGDAFRIGNRADIAAIERVPLEHRVTAASTYELILRGAAIAPDEPALIVLDDADPAHPPRVISHRELARRVTQAANLFTSLGVGPGDVVASLLPNMAQSHYTIWGGEAAGVVCLVNPMLETDHIVHLLQSAAARVLVVPAAEEDAEIAQRLDGIAARVPGLRAVLRAGGPAGDRPGLLHFDALLDGQPHDRLISGRRIAADDIASYFHTGGTTGLPKLARHTHRGEVYQAWALAAHCDIRARDRIMVGLPLFHNSAVINLGLAPFSVGAAAVLLGKRGFRDPAVIRDFWRLVERHRGTFFVAVPTVYSALLQHPVEGDVSSLRFALCGAAPAPERLLAETGSRTGVRVLEGYGLTEATCGAACNPKDGASKSGSIGLALAYQPMKVVRIDAEGRWDRDCAVDEIGALVVKGPGVFPGYVDPAHNRRLFVADGWLNTGDLARQDADGYFWIVGRAKDVIIRGGHNIDPAADRGGAAGAFRRPYGSGRGSARPSRWRAAGGLRRARARDRCRQRGTAGFRAVPYRRARRGAGRGDDRRGAASDHGGQGLELPLRHDATRQAIEALLSAIEPPLSGFSVAVRSDARHGTLAEVRVTGVPADRREAVRRAADAQLARLSVHWVLHVDCAAE
jgi:fatty-acyl-CoA synthase